MEGCIPSIKEGGLGIRSLKLLGFINKFWVGSNDWEVFYPSKTAASIWIAIVNTNGVLWRIRYKFVNESLIHILDGLWCWDTGLSYSFPYLSANASVLTNVWSPLFLWKHLLWGDRVSLALAITTSYSKHWSCGSHTFVWGIAVKFDSNWLNWSNNFGSASVPNRTTPCKVSA